MPGTPIETVGWDSSIFLAWLHDEQRPAGEMEGVAQSLFKIESGASNLVASALIRGEVRMDRLPTDFARQTFAGFLRRSNVEVPDAGQQIMQFAGELCDFYDKQKASTGSGRSLCMPDAIHLATSIIYKAKAFYTFDEKGTGRCLGLIPLSGNVAGHKLTICKPPYTPPQPIQLKLIKP